MISEPTTKSIDLLEESLEELESSKGSIHSGIQKLSRAARLVNNNSIYVWCKAQLGDKKYTMPLKNYIEAFTPVHGAFLSQCLRSGIYYTTNLDLFGADYIPDSVLCQIV